MAPNFSVPTPATKDVGLGTAYERAAIYRRISRWFERDLPRSVLEGPWDGMAGMPGLHALGLARAGVPVSVVLPSDAAVEAVRCVYRRARCDARLETHVGSELPDRSFDLVVSFNALPLVADWRGYLAELARRASRLALFVTHPHSYGAWARRALRVTERGRRRELYDHEATRPRTLRPELLKLGTLVEEAWVDCPWWPDLFVETGSSLAAGLLGTLTRNRLAAPPARFVYPPDAFPFVGDELPRELARALARHPSFEDSRLAPAFAHHRAYLLRTA